jgi:hypothetical protein
VTHAAWALDPDYAALSSDEDPHLLRGYDVAEAQQALFIVDRALNVLAVLAIQVVQHVDGQRPPAELRMENAEIRFERHV